MSKIVMISYDLWVPETTQSYKDVISKIKSHALSSVSPLKSVWLIKTDSSVSDIRDDLKYITDVNDKILVINITKPSGWRNRAWSRLSKDASDWISLHMN